MISQIEMEMVRAKAMVTGVAIFLGLALTNPTSQDYQIWNTTPAASRVNLLVGSLYDGHVVGIASFFFSL